MGGTGCLADLELRDGIAGTDFECLRGGGVFGSFMVRARGAKTRATVGRAASYV